MIPVPEVESGVVPADHPECPVTVVYGTLRFYVVNQFDFHAGYIEGGGLCEALGHGDEAVFSVNGGGPGWG
jgi:hypothetical protein